MQINKEIKENIPIEDNDDQLKHVWLILKQIHDEFFSKKNETVANLLKKIKKKVLSDVHILFSGVIPNNILPENSLIWKLAEEFGATCYNTFCPQVTHVVATMVF